MMQITDERFAEIERIILLYSMEKINNPALSRHTSPKHIHNKMEENLDAMDVVFGNRNSDTF